MKRGRVIIGLKYDGGLVNQEIKTSRDIYSYVFL
jgi:hypothetical protein